jgi:hypothetical protein
MRLRMQARAAAAALIFEAGRADASALSSRVLVKFKRARR